MSFSTRAARLPAFTLRHARPQARTHLQSKLQSTRHTSTASSSSSSPSPTTPLRSSLKPLLYTSALLLFGTGTYLAVTDTRFSALHRHLIVPALRYFIPDGESAHAATTATLKALYPLNLHPRDRTNPAAEPSLAVSIFGHDLQNPIGTSAGIDKGAEVPDALLALGGAYVEVGGIVPLPQAGNAKPRLFRIVSQNALINRFGLNSEGADRVALRLRERVRRYALAHGLGGGEEGERRVLDGEAGVPPGSLIGGKLMGVQVGKNKDTPDDIDSVVADYVYCVDRLARYADVVVVNVSSPNTEGLRDLQAQGPLTRLLTEVVKATKSIERKTKPKVMVKVSPDEDAPAQVQGICQAIWDSGVDGVIVGNTTKARPAALPAGYKLDAAEEKIMTETGGYSGPQLFERTVALVGRYRETLDEGLAGKDAPPKVVFGSGGITDGRQALQVLQAGADMVQVYTGLVYGGAGTITRMKHEMRREIDRMSKKE